MLRRRVLDTGSSKELTLSSYSYEATPASGSATVTAYYGEEPITDLTASLITTSSLNATVNSSGVITMSYGSNTSTYSTITRTMTLTYKGQTVTFIITQAKDYVTEQYNSETNTYYPSTSPYTLTSDVTDKGDGTSSPNLNILWNYRVQTTTTPITKYASGRTVSGTPTTGQIHQTTVGTGHGGNFRVKNGNSASTAFDGITTFPVFFSKLSGSKMQCTSGHSETSTLKIIIEVTSWASPYTSITYNGYTVSK